MIPKLAVVGHPNKGKSSIVSTLAEDVNVAVSAVPGTTVAARYFPFRIDGRVIYELIDTPGFQRPRQVLNWLEENCAAASERAETVAKFVRTHRGEAKFHDECELLAPLIDGAGILYVVDGSKPFGAEYETEMQILRWTGRPRMALINLIDDGDYIEEWKRALDQYFSMVRIFDAHSADAETRLSLLRSFAEIDVQWRDAMEQAATNLEHEYQRRQRQSAQCIAALILTALTATRKNNISDSADLKLETQKLEGLLRNDLRKAEQTMQASLASIYRHKYSNMQELAPDNLLHDLFSQQSKALFGLSAGQLATSGAFSGAVAGTGIDVMLGGASLFTGAAVGAIVGAISTTIGADKLGKLKLFGRPLAERELEVGPFRDINLPWILLARACLLFRLLSTRNHARRDEIVLSTQDTTHLANEFSPQLRKELSHYFASVRAKPEQADRHKLVLLIIRLLAAQTAGD